MDTAPRHLDFNRQEDDYRNYDGRYNEQDRQRRPPTMSNQQQPRRFNPQHEQGERPKPSNQQQQRRLTPQHEQVERPPSFMSSPPKSSPIRTVLTHDLETSKRIADTGRRMVVTLKDDVSNLSKRVSLAVGKDSPTNKFGAVVNDLKILTHEKFGLVSKQAAELKSIVDHLQVELKATQLELKHLQGQMNITEARLRTNEHHFKDRSTPSLTSPISPEFVTQSSATSIATIQDDAFDTGSNASAADTPKPKVKRSRSATKAQKSKQPVAIAGAATHVDKKIRYSPRAKGKKTATEVNTDDGLIIPDVHLDSTSMPDVDNYTTQNAEEFDHHFWDLAPFNTPAISQRTLAFTVLMNADPTQHKKNFHAVTHNGTFKPNGKQWTLKFNDEHPANQCPVCGGTMTLRYGKPKNKNPGRPYAICSAQTSCGMGFLADLE